MQHGEDGVTTVVLCGTLGHVIVVLRCDPLSLYINHACVSSLVAHQVQLQACTQCLAPAFNYI